MRAAAFPLLLLFVLCAAFPASAGQKPDDRKPDEKKDKPAAKLPLGRDSNFVFVRKSGG